MPLELWIGFAVTSAVLVAIPGPTVMLVVSYALARGRRSAWATVPGVVLGDFTAMTVSLMGAGAILAASAALFTALKLAGAVYLVWLGIRLWRARPAPQAADGGAPARGAGRMFVHAFAVTTLNPKGIVFFIAFLPLFVSPAHPVLLQFAVLEGTFMVLAALNAAVWAMLAAELRARLASPTALRYMNRTGGSLLLCAGGVTALAHRTA